MARLRSKGGSDPRGPPQDQQGIRRESGHVTMARKGPPQEQRRIGRSRPLSDGVGHFLEGVSELAVVLRELPACVTLSDNCQDQADPGTP